MEVQSGESQPDETSIEEKGDRIIITNLNSVIIWIVLKHD